MSDSTYDLSKIIEAESGGEGAASAENNVFVVNSSGSTTVTSFNIKRHFVIIQNSIGTLYIKLGVTVSPTDYSFTIKGDAFASISDYTGPITVISDMDNDNVRVTEIG